MGNLGGNSAWANTLLGLLHALPCQLSIAARLRDPREPSITVGGNLSITRLLGMSQRRACRARGSARWSVSAAWYSWPQIASDWASITIGSSGLCRLIA